MAPQVLFYERAVPISSEQHRDVAVHGSADYGFAKKINVVPLTLPEFPIASGDYPIVFIGQNDDLVPAAVLGIRDAENLFVTPEGRWDARYVPAFVRRYPFVFANAPEDQRLILCIDEASAMVNRDGRGERLFDSTGARTTYLDNVLTFMQRYQVAFQRSQQFAKRLKELDLLQPVQAQIRGPAGAMQLRGFMTINRERLKALETSVIEELLRNDGLEAAFLHLSSTRNLQALASRMPSGTDAAPAPPRQPDPLNEGDILLN